MTTSNANKRLDKIESDLSAAGLADEPSAYEIEVAERVERQNAHYLQCIDTALHLWPQPHARAIVSEFETVTDWDQIEIRTEGGFGKANGLSVALNAVLAVARNLYSYEGYAVMPLPVALCDWFADDPARDFRAISQSEFNAGKINGWRWLNSNVHCHSCGLPLPARKCGSFAVVDLVDAGTPDPERLPFVVCPACNSPKIAWSVQSGFIPNETLNFDNMPGRRRRQ